LNTVLRHGFYSANPQGIAINHLSSGTDQKWAFYIFSGGDLALNYGGLGPAVGTFDFSDGSYTSSSDGRFKRTINTLPGQMEKILQLRPTTYAMTGSKSSRRHYGFIAQEVQELFPDIVKVIGTVRIAEKGQGELTIKAGTYPVGTYYYSLVLDGEVQETRRMVLTK